MMARNPFVREISCLTCSAPVRVNPLGLWGHEVIRCNSCQASLRVRYRIPSFVLTFIVLTLVYGLIWLVPWQGKAIGIVYLAMLVIATPVLVAWVLGEFIAAEKAPEKDANREKAG